MINRLFLLLVFFFASSSIGMTLSAADLRGVVSRPAKAPTEPKKVDRYRSRAQTETMASDCLCQPHLYAVVWLTSDSLPPLKLPDSIPTLSQKNIMFEPSVIAVPVGASVSFPNLDPFFHNVFSYSKTKKFDLGRYEQGETKLITFDKPGIVQVFCEIHFSMRAYVHVLETPYFAVSDQLGKFLITNVRPGTYTMHTWQENQPMLKQSVTVPADTALVTIE